MKRKILSLTVIISMLLSCIITVSPETTISAEENDSVIFSSDFEDGSINEWTPFGGGGKLSVDKSTCHDGKNSLKITGREQSFHGPSISGDSFFKPKNEYTFSAWVYQNSDSEKTISWTMRYVDSIGTSQFMQIASADLKPGEWTELSNTVPMPEDSISYLLYFECANATTDFNVDDVVITGEKTDETENENVKKGALYSFDFENGTELWSPRGDNRLVRTDEHAYTGSHSIYVTNRTKTWNGPTVNVNDIKRGVSYFYSAYVMYTGDEYDDVHGMRMELQYNLNGETKYNLITAKDVKKDTWTRITGTFTVPEDAADVAFYIQTRNLEDDDELTTSDLLSFYTDTVTISETSVVHGQTAVTVFIYFAAALAALIIIRLIIMIIIKKINNRKAVLTSKSKDAMTQCLNRNAYETRLAELSKSPEQCKNLFFALCDVNFLKYINDNLGHEKGDEAITRCGQILMNTVGSNGDVYRIGGDEFVCITSVSLKEQIRKALDEGSVEDKGYPFAVAAGFTEYSSELDSETPDIQKIMERCDHEMYTNKQEIKAKNKEFSRK